jgi:hypothetical protein
MSFKLVQAHTAGQFHLLPLLLPHLVPAVLLLLLSSSAPASTSTVVTHLPGFDGPLPFYLETGWALAANTSSPILKRARDSGRRHAVQVRGRGWRNGIGALLLLHRVGAERQHGSPDPLADGRASLHRLQRPRLRSWSCEVCVGTI